MSSRYVVNQTGVFNGRELRYEFVLECVRVVDSRGKPAGTASVFSYIADLSVEEQSTRPVVFAFNGGPGSASLYLHLGGIGPKRVAIPIDLREGLRPPFVLEDSPHSLLDVADIVFVDPINTGFGRAAPDADLSEIYSIEGDARYFSNIVRDWINKAGRWNSPKYILGESYGTHRAVFLADILFNVQSIALDGVILLGQAINVQETLDRHGNLAGAIAGLEFKTATAWFHGKGAQEFSSVEEAVKAATVYSNGEFASALLKGNQISSDEQERVAKTLEGFTGIDAKVYIKNRLWLTKNAFLKQLLGDISQTLGSCDSRYTGWDCDEAAGESDTDPSLGRTKPGFVACGAQYFGAAGFALDDEYRLRDSTASDKWEWREPNARGFMRFGNPSPFETYPYVSRLTQFLKQVEHARLFIATGIYDSLTTVGATEHLLRHYAIPADRVSSHSYPAGHMMYTDPSACCQLNDDLRSFVCPRL